MDGPLLSTLVRRLHLLFRQRIHADLVAAGHGRLTPAHMYIFQLPGPDGIRPTELARRTNMTKQAMNHLLAGLERDGYLRRESAPDDGRGTVIRLTDRGRDVQRIMQDSSRRLEDEWAADLADGSIEHLRDILTRVDTAVGAPP
jgi:DNA-binding MarR family transcriptional regulator